MPISPFDYFVPVLPETAEDLEAELAGLRLRCAHLARERAQLLDTIAARTPLERHPCVPSASR